MNIPLKTWMKYKDKLAAIDRRAEVEMISFVQSIGGYGDHVNECLDYAFALATKYGEAAGAAACELYEAVAAASGITLEAMPAATATYEEVAKSLNGIHKISNDPAKLSQGVSRLVKRTAADTTLQNAVRDGAYFAWVPSGDTCAFCLMLASNGWRKAGKKTLKGDHAEHIHANCDCQYAVTFDPLSGVEGYDPAEYEAIFDGIDGDWNKKVKVVRQRQYAANPEKYRAQHRATYALRATGGRILDLYGDYENKWAESYYEEIRHKTTDCRKIAERLNISEESIKDIKNYLFYDKSWYNDLTEQYERFAADPAIAQSWQRLAEGKQIMPHDVTLINHELYEMKLKKDNPGISHSEAHTMATYKYNFQEEAEAYYANLRESEKNRK